MTSPAVQSPYYQLPREAQLSRARAKLSGAAFQLLNYIESKRFNAKKTQYITPTNEELATVLGCDERTITRSLARLDKDGFTRTIAQTPNSVRRIYLSTAAGASAPESKKLPTVGPAGLVASRETMAEVRAGQNMLPFDATASNVIQLPVTSCRLPVKDEEACSKRTPQLCPPQLSSTIAFGGVSSSLTQALSDSVKTRSNDVEGVDISVHPLDKIVHPPDIQATRKTSVDNVLVFEVEKPKTYTTENTNLKTTAVVPVPAGPLFDTCSSETATATSTANHRGTETQRTTTAIASEILLKRKQQQNFQANLNRKPQRLCVSAVQIGDVMPKIIPPKPSSDSEAIFQQLGRCCAANGLTGAEVVDLLKYVRGVNPGIDTGYAWRVLAWVCNVKRKRSEGKVILRPVGWVRSMLKFDPADMDLRAAKWAWSKAD